MLKQNKTKTIALIISLLSLACAYTFNAINLDYLRADSVDLRSDETVITADDNSYLTPAFNYLKTGEFKNNMTGKGAYFLRPPGYSLIFVALGYWTDLKTSLQWLKILQLTLYFLSIYALFFIAYNYLKSIKMAVFITAFYGISNIASGFLFYTLTEGITPALVIFYIYFLMSAKSKANAKSKRKHYYIAAAIFSFLFITRPFLGILGMAFPFFLYADYGAKKNMFYVQMLFVGLIASSSMLVWQIRNWSIAKEFVGLHPIYYSENSNSCFRPPHRELWNLCKGWGENGGHFHSYINPFWQSAIEGHPSDKDIENIINQFPKKVVEKLGKEHFIEMFNSYQQSILFQKYYYDNKLPMPQKMPEMEQKTITQIKALTSDFKKHFWFQYYLVSPLKVFKELSFHSNLSLYIFQKTFRGSCWMEALRLLSFLIHSASFLLLIFSLFFDKKVYLKSVFSFAMIIYVFYLIFVQRGIEERYTLPILSLVLINFGYALLKVKSILQNAIRDKIFFLRK